MAAVPPTPPSVADVRTVTVRVPAKINLVLSVGPTRPDGFHELLTVFHAVGLYDTVTATASDRLGLQVRGDEAAGVPADHRNLAWRAALLLAERAGVAADVGLTVTKQIPVAAGLAGGSADAAATLLACQRLWQLRLPAGELDRLAAELGSDVSFALHGHSAVGTGRGEQLSAVAGAAEFHWVLAVAEGGLSTPAVYAELDRQRAARPDRPRAASLPKVLAALDGGVAARLAPLIGNELQDAALALAPQLRDTLATGAAAGALAGLVSGSGPTCAFLAREAGHARELAAALAAGPTCRYAVPVLGGVPGAGVLDPAAAS
ncbi:MAG: 4-(cytidine 5'-diphospho)-2-C-methyl-D-erythritol kinase [Jatrophihabitans sp.]